MNGERALSRVRGLGSAHEGAHHWRTQRLTALALVALGPWLVVSLLLLPDLGYATLRAWSSNLFNGSLLALLVIVACWHAQLGVQVVIEDYLQGWLRPASLVVSAFIHVVLATLSVLAIVRIALGN